MESQLTDDRLTRSPDNSISDPIAAYLLKTLTEAVIEAMNTIPDRDSDAFLVKHLSPDWHLMNCEGRDCALPMVTSRDAHIENLKLLRQSYPNWRLDVYHLSVMVDPAGETGEVQYTSRSRGGPGNKFNEKQELVGIMHWRKRAKDGVWESYGHHGIKGPGTFA